MFIVTNAIDTSSSLCQGKEQGFLTRKAFSNVKKGKQIGFFFGKWEANWLLHRNEANTSINNRNLKAPKI